VNFVVGPKPPRGALSSIQKRNERKAERLPVPGATGVS
jgi:hypothetical protein